MAQIDKETIIRKNNMKLFPWYKMFSWDLLFFYSMFYFSKFNDMFISSFNNAF